MAQYIIQQVKQIIEEKKNMSEANILLCGISYKKDSNDVRTSPPLNIMQALLETAGSVEYFDPFVPSIQIDAKTYHSVQLSPEKLKEKDIILLLVDHSLLPIQTILDHATIVYDTKNVTNGYKGKAKVVLLGSGNIPSKG